MDCLKGYISLDACGSSSPAGRSILTLPGITLESIDKIATNDQITYAKVWDDVQAEAALRFKTDFISKVNECFEINTECDYEEFICENKDKLVNSWRFLLGNQLMVYRIYSTRLNRFTTLDIDIARELKDLYQNEYEKYLSLEVKFIDFSSCCMACGGNPQTVTWLP